MRISNKFTRGHPCESVTLMKLQSNFIEITLPHGCSPVNLLHIFRTTFHKKTSGEMLLFEWVLSTLLGQKKKGSMTKRCLHVVWNMFDNTIYKKMKKRIQKLGCFLTFPARRKFAHPPPPSRLLPLNFCPPPFHQITIF